MAQWTHNICLVCWGKENPNREPAKMLQAEEETCCSCGKVNTDGIYIRHNPEFLKFCRCKKD